jgi:probable rRNA maturation factor
MRRFRPAAAPRSRRASCAAPDVMGPDDQSRDRSRIYVAVSDARGRPISTGLSRWLTRVAPARARGSVNIAVVSDRRVRALNRQYRGIDRTTDVLSFPATNLPQNTQNTQKSQPKNGFANSAGSAVKHFLGDIVIARGVARRQARSAGHAEETELRVLALHGLLHLLGYDHEGDSGAMARLERRLRRKGGLREGLIERR